MNHYKNKNLRTLNLKEGVKTMKQKKAKIDWGPLGFTALFGEMRGTASASAWSDDAPLAADCCARPVFPRPPGSDSFDSQDLL